MEFQNRVGEFALEIEGGHILLLKNGHFKNILCWF